MPKDSIELDFRVPLPGGRWWWTDSPEGRGARRDEHGVNLPPPFLIRAPDPSATPSAARVVDRSGAGLYRDFRALAKHTLEPEQAVFADAVVRFAKRYGFLGEPVSPYAPMPDSRWVLPERPAEAESLQFWGREVQSFYELDTLAEALRLKDIEALGKRIVWDKDVGEIRYVHPGKLRWTNNVIATKDRHPVRYERLSNRPRTEDAAWVHLGLELNKRIENALHVFVPPERKRLAVARPRTLLDALYLRLYHKAANIEWERRCKQCGHPLLPDATVRRDFCGNTCRSRWNRRTGG